MIASGFVENNGIVLRNIKYLYYPKLILIYYQDKIYPSYECGFFEKKLSLSGYVNRVESPWIFSGISDTITFFVYNNSNEDITVHLENSPNAIQHVDDPQKICVHPDQTIDIVPYKFSKFIRLVANSERGKIDCKLWFQTQLKNMS
jgi:hypothetical protein